MADPVRSSLPSAPPLSAPSSRRRQCRRAGCTILRRVTTLTLADVQRLVSERVSSVSRAGRVCGEFKVQAVKKFLLSGTLRPLQRQSWVPSLRLQPVSTCCFGCSPPDFPPTRRQQSHSPSGISVGAACGAATQLARRHREGRRDQAASCTRQPRRHDEAVHAKRGVTVEGLC